MTDTSVAAWQKSRSCNGASSCVEVLSVDGCVLVRDSKLGEESPVLCWTALEWTLFVDALRFSQLGTYGGPVVLAGAGGEWRMWRDGAHDVALEFDQAELDAFMDGVKRGDFNTESRASGMHGSDGTARARLSEPPVAASGADSVPR